MPREAEANPKRVVAGRRNRTKRGPLTPEGRERLRKAVLLTQPWQYSTGPRTEEGKSRTAANGKKAQTDAISVREARSEVANLLALTADPRHLRSAISIEAS